MNRDSVTLRSIAQKAGVSVATVSRVLNNYEGVSEERKEAVKNAIAEMHYVYKPKSSYTPKKRIGVLVADICNDAYGPLLRGILEVAGNNDAEILLYDYQRNKHMENAYIREMTASHVDGLIAVPSGGKLGSEYEKLITDQFPLVLLMNSREQLERQDIFSIALDTCAGAYTGTKYMLDLGHKDILILGVPGEQEVYASKLSGYIQAFESVGVPVRKTLIVNCFDSFEDAYRIVQQRCQNRDFSAIFAVSGNLTMGAWKALKDNGLKVPQDISIVGYGTQKLTDYLSLTVLTEPMQEIGKNAVHTVLQWLKGSRTLPKTTILRDSLTIGNSCQKI